MARSQRADRHRGRNSRPPFFLAVAGGALRLWGCPSGPALRPESPRAAGCGSRCGCTVSCGRAGALPLRTAGTWVIRPARDGAWHHPPDHDQRGGAGAAGARDAHQMRRSCNFDGDAVDAMSGGADLAACSAAGRRRSRIAFLDPPQPGTQCSLCRKQSSTTDADEELPLEISSDRHHEQPGSSVPVMECAAVAAEAAARRGPQSSPPTSTLSCKPRCWVDCAALRAGFLAAGAAGLRCRLQPRTENPT